MTLLFNSSFKAPEIGLYAALPCIKVVKCASVFAVRFSALRKVIFEYFINSQFKYTVFDYLINNQKLLYSMQKNVQQKLVRTWRPILETNSN